MGMMLVPYPGEFWYYSEAGFLWHQPLIVLGSRYGLGGLISGVGQWPVLLIVPDGDHTRHLPHRADIKHGDDRCLFYPVMASVAGRYWSGSVYTSSLPATIAASAAFMLPVATPT